jgi:DNA-binding transcriptional MerR regulator
VVQQSQEAKLLKIGEVSLGSGLPVKTIRYYDEIGLLVPTVVRSPAGYRLFHPQILNRLAFIRRAQSLGLHLNEVQQILTVHDQGQRPCGEVRHHLESKLTEVHQQIEALETLKIELQGILSGWQDQPSSDRFEQTICPNLQKGGVGRGVSGVGSGEWGVGSGWVTGWMGGWVREEGHIHTSRNSSLKKFLYLRKDIHSDMRNSLLQNFLCSRESLP